MRSFTPLALLSSIGHALSEPSISTSTALSIPHEPNPLDGKFLVPSASVRSKKKSSLPPPTLEIDTIRRLDTRETPLEYIAQYPTADHSDVEECTKLPELGACIPCEGNPGKDPTDHCGLDIHSNWYEQVPNTCQTREYNFTVEETVISPDGVERIGLIVNGQMPGPAIEANWGDWIVVHLTNAMPLNGTSLHMHGLYQNHTNEMDGVPSITQCPLAPGQTQTYRFRATNYGTSWWHSHFAIQTYEGVFGPIIIHGPKGDCQYDHEQMIVLQDWSHYTVDSVFLPSQEVSSGYTSAPTLDTGLINGLNVWGDDGDPKQTGKRFEMTVKKGSTYRFRIVSAAIGATFKFYLDGHKMTVIAVDFTPIVPYETDIINISTGQRYDVLITFDQEVNNYWLRSDNQQDCQDIIQAKNIRGIVRYEGAPDWIPYSSPYPYTDECIDEPSTSLVPIVPITAGPSTFNIQKEVLIGANGGHPNLYKWTLSGTTFQSKWSDPTLSQIYHNGTVPTYSGNLAIQVPTLNEWVYVVIESPIPLPHPIHLHGHDFLVLAQGLGNYSTDVPLNTKTPPRRDTAVMPYSRKEEKGGYLVIAFQANNPGAWLLHCHTGWHSAMGFALQIIVNLEGIRDTVHDSCSLDEVCKAWNEFSGFNNVMAAPWESGI